MPQVADDNNFDEVTGTDATPVLVDFWAPSCKPCLALAPVLEDVEAKAEGKFRLVKVNVDECGKVAERFNVLGLPTLMIYKDGKTVARKVGSVSRPALEEWLSQNLG